MRLSACIFCLLVGTSSLSAQDARPALALADSVRQLAHIAFLHDDSTAFATARSVAERGVARFPDNALLLHYLGYIDFRLAVLHLQSGKGGDETKREVRARLQSAEEFLTRSAELQAIPETYALLSAIVGIRVAVGSRVTALFHIRRAHERMDRAIALDPRNPRVRLIKGINAAQMPSLLGGGNDRAQKELETALDLFRNDTARPPMPTWGYAEAYAWLGSVYAREGRKDLARQAYENALRIEPESNRVRKVMLPRLNRIASSSKERM